MGSSIALHLLGALGFVIVVSFSTIAVPIRARVWPEMLSCPQCFGVWGGACWAFALGLRSELPEWFALIHDGIAFAFAVSLLGYLVAVLATISAAHLPRHPRPPLR